MIENIEPKRDLITALEKQEAALWHSMEKEILTHATTMARRDAVRGVVPLLDAYEEFRTTAQVIADGIRQLTSIIRQEILIKDPNLGMEEVAVKVDETLRERIEFHFRPHEVPDVPRS